MSEGMQTAGRGARGQFLMLGGVFACVVALLALGYFLFLRTDYTVLAQGLRGSDAALVVAELDKRGTAYRIRDGGSTILVPEGEADATRVALAGSDVAARGEIGFELFNKSDMGLTNFAQKINYQRALQGELVRTIMAMDGVESARVHLSMPERTLFRGDRAEPKAAVTVGMKPGQVADPSRVAGIQRLVAAAVSDLPEAQVVVLDSGGRVISQAAVDAAADERPADLEERTAVEGYYRARARGAVERQMPGLKFALRVLVVPDANSTRSVTEVQPSGEAGWVPAGEGPARNFHLRFIFVTTNALGVDDQEVACAAIIQGSGADMARGDTLSFEVGPVDLPVATSAPVPSTVQRTPPLPDPTPIASSASLPDMWLWIVAGIALLVLLGWLFFRSRARLGAADHEAFADRLRRQLNLSEDDVDAVA